MYKSRSLRKQTRLEFMFRSVKRSGIAAECPKLTIRQLGVLCGLSLRPQRLKILKKRTKPGAFDRKER